jgi:hypothetical protein
MLRDAFGDSIHKAAEKCTGKIRKPLENEYTAR